MIYPDEIPVWFGIPLAIFLMGVLVVIKIRDYKKIKENGENNERS